MKSGMEELKNQIMLKRNNGNQNFAGYLGIYIYIYLLYS